jgi:glutaredoxin-like protein
MPREGPKGDINKLAEKLLNQDIEKQIKEAFDTQLQKPVQVIYFGKEDDCEYCADTRQLVEEVVALTDKVELELHDIEKDTDLARKYNVERAPGLVIAGKDGAELIDFGVRFAGIPSGYEFSSLIQSLVLVSNRDSGLKETTRQVLKNLTEPVHMLVFTTPT